MGFLDKKLVDMLINGAKGKLEEIANKLDLNANGIRDLQEVLDDFDTMVDAGKQFVQAASKLSVLVALYINTFKPVVEKAAAIEGPTETETA